MIGPIAYIGGKNRLAKRIIDLMPPHVTYVEPFAGGAQVFFHKAKSTVEVLNDLDGELINFYRVCRWHYEELARILELMPASRDEFRRQSISDPALLTDIQRAARFLYLQKNAFGGLVRKQSFHYGVTQPSNYNPSRLRDSLGKAQQRLQRVQLECSPYEEVLARYDRQSTFFYLDPPYYRRDLYKYNFSENDFEVLASRLQGITGRFLLSLNDTPQVRSIFSRFELLPAELAYTAQRRPVARYRELLIRN